MCNSINKLGKTVVIMAESNLNKKYLKKDKCRRLKNGVVDI